MKSIQTNIINSATLLVQLLNVKITKSTIQNAIEQNPHYPSLFCIGDVFLKFNIPSQAFNLAPEQFLELEAPFIAYWKNDFVTVTKKLKGAITYTDFDGKTITSPTETFLKNYKNIVLVAEPNTESGELDYEKSLKKEKSGKIKKLLLIAASLFALTLIFFQFYSFNTLNSIGDPWLTILTTATKLVGLSATILLLIYEIDKSNTLVKNICAVGKQTSCEAVLNSKASRFMGLSWSEIGFYYFATTALFLLFPGIALGLKAPYLAISSAIVSPYVFFSIYYQWKIIKRWCPLCLVVQVTLLTELLWSFGMLQNSGEINWIVNESLLIAVTLSTLLPIIVWNLIKPLFLTLKQTDGYEAAYKRMLYNPEIFNALLQQQPQAPEGWREIGITIGNPKVSKTIIKVCNPFCGPCAKAHPLLEEIIKQNPEYNLKVIFTSTNHALDRGGVVARHLLAIAEKGNAEQTQKALDDWYMAKEKDYEKFSIQYPLNGEIEKQKIRIEAMQEWCKEASITHTPTVFINGKRLPENYSVDALRYIL